MTLLYIMLKLLFLYLRDYCLCVHFLVVFFFEKLPEIQFDGLTMLLSKNQLCFKKLFT